MNHQMKKWKKAEEDDLDDWGKNMQDKNNMNKNLHLHYQSKVWTCLHI